MANDSTMKWFNHDLNAHDDIKIKKLLKRHGFSALGIYWFLIELLCKKGGRIEFNEAVDEVTLVDGLSEDEVRKLINYQVEIGLFFLEGSLLGSHRADKEIKKNETSHAQAVERGKKGGTATQANLKSVSRASQEQLESNSSASKANTIQFNTIQSNINNPPIIPPTGQSEDIVQKEGEFKSAAYDGVSSHDISPIYKERFNSIDGVIKCEKITVKREIAVSTILSHFTQDEINKVFEKVADSAFLKGNNSTGFKVTFDWLFNLDNFTKVLEGNFDNRKGKVEKPEEKNLLDEYTPEQIAASKKSEEEARALWRRDHGITD